MQDQGVSPLRRGAAATLQLNIGLYCNQVRWAPARWSPNVACKGLCLSHESSQDSMQHL